MQTGKLKKFFADKGFGFIVSDAGGDDVFAHKMSFSGPDADNIQGGEKVQYESSWDDQKGKYKASNWSIIGGGGGGGGGGAFQATGKVKKFFPDKGFGFITPDTGGDDLFAHSRQFQGGEADSLQEGESVGYDPEWDDKKGKNKAGRWGRSGGGGGGGGSMPQGQMGYGMPQQQMGMPQQQMGMMGMHQQQMGMPQGGFGPMGGHPGMDPRSSPYGGGPAPQQGLGGAPAALPPGWESAQDPGSGKTYFFNRGTGETSWTPPVAPAAAAPPMAPQQPLQQAPQQLPPGWEQANDPSSGKTYYFNRGTGQTSWEFPR